MKAIVVFKKQGLQCFVWALLVVFCIGYFHPLQAQDSEDEASESPRFELEEIVVTASREERRADTIPKGVTVITAEDIEQSTAGNIVDLLGREASLNLRSVTGNEGRSGVDIRGMGDTYVSNVIVMVDGVRLNASDLSGADFLSIPLGQVERVEIVRGGASVLYGNGAVGGVINIITKKPEEPFSAKLSANGGSFNTYGGRFQVGTSQGQYFLGASGGYTDSRGYRDNGDLRKKDASISMGYDPTEKISLSTDASVVESIIGLPGPVPLSIIESRELRRRTGDPKDFTSSIDRRYNAKADFRTSVGDFSIKGGYRNRDNGYIIGYTPLLSEEAQTDTIAEDALTLNLVHTHNLSFGRFENSTVSGIDYYKTDYTREDLKAEKKNGNTQTIEAFFHDELVLNKRLFLSAGYRYSWFSGTFQDENHEDFFGPPPGFILLYSQYVPENAREKDWTNDAYEIGLTWQAMESVSIFASHSKSFRIPNVDEFAESDDDLHPQTALHYDTGFKAALGDRAELSVTGFLMTATDEIYYGEDPVTKTSLNRNYDQKTKRRGVETEIKVYPADWLFCWANYSYTRARFEETNTAIPLVPEHMGNFGIEWYPHETLTLAFSGTMASERFDGNDQDNVQDDFVLGSYQVYDAKLTWQRDRFRAWFGVNNVFDTLYVTSSYSGQGYPMPTRAFFFGLEWTY